MRCYNCAAELSEHNFCTNCGADVGMYKKIIRASNYYYNQGLERAKVRDLSGAILSLRESLRFNRNNIKARNLLGLVYFETGEVVAAMSEWVISKNYKPKKNIAAEYIEILQSSTTQLDNLNQTAKKYNQALLYCQQGSRDMAVIQLKKVVAMNPKFIRARQLLALLFLTSGKPEPAKRHLEKCREIDINNTTTLRYLMEADSMLNPEVQDKKSAKEKEKEKNNSITYTIDNELIIQPTGIKERRGSAGILNILVGIAVGFSIAFFLILPARIQNEKAAAQEEIKSFGTQLDAKNLTITDLETKVSEQDDKIAALTESLDAYAGTEGTLLSMESLLKASALYLDNPESVLDVADYISAVDESSWTDDTSENYKALYYALKKAIGPAVCLQYYAEGESAYRDKEYEDAIAYFSNAVFFDSGNVEAIYMLANSYRVLENKEEAKKYFDIVIEKFPDTWYAGKSQSYLKEME